MTNKNNIFSILFKNVLVLFLILFLFLSKNLYAEQTLDGIYYDWYVFTLTDLGEEQKCYKAEASA